MLNTQDDGEGVLNFCIPISIVLEQTWRAFTSLKLCNCSQNPHPAYRQHQTPKNTNHHLLNHPQTLHTHTHTHTHTKLRHPAHCCVGLRGRNSRNKKMKLNYQVAKLTLMTNSQVIAKKGWMVRCSPRAPEF